MSFLSRQTRVSRAKTRLLSAQTFCRAKLTYVATKHVFCRLKRFVAPSLLMSQQTRLLSRQKYACRDKMEDVFCRDKNDTCGSSHQ